MNRSGWWVLLSVLTMVGCSEDGNDGTCVARDLADYCAEHDCPATPADVEPVCGDERSTIRRATVCGGTFVDVSYGLGGTAYYFDADDVLIGLQTMSDVGEQCEPEGGGIASAIYGETCAATGPEMDRCESSEPKTCAPGDLSKLCETFRCPATLEAGSECSGFEKELRANDCGGKNVSASSSFAGAVLSYDAQGDLVGLRLFSDVPELCDGTAFEQPYGSPCHAVGEPELICSETSP